MGEKDEFNHIVDTHEECRGVKQGGGGCACLGGCLGNHLAKLRKKYDGPLKKGEYTWWSDQLHGALKKREHDSGVSGQPLNAKNYWPEP